MSAETKQEGPLVIRIDCADRQCRALCLLAAASLIALSGVAMPLADVAAAALGTTRSVAVFVLLVVKDGSAALMALWAVRMLPAQGARFEASLLVGVLVLRLFDDIATLSFNPSLSREGNLMIVAAKDGLTLPMLHRLMFVNATVHALLMAAVLLGIGRYAAACARAGGGRVGFWLTVLVAAPVCGQALQNGICALDWSAAYLLERGALRDAVLRVTEWLVQGDKPDLWARPGQILGAILFLALVRAWVQAARARATPAPPPYALAGNVNTRQPNA